MYRLPAWVVVIDQTPERVDQDSWADRTPNSEEVRFAQRAICVHAPQRWRHGKYCLNCHAPFPCRLHRWGRRVLRAAGWSDWAIAAMFAAYQRTSLPPWLSSTG